MSDNEGNELSLAETEDLGENKFDTLNDEIWLVDSPQPSNQESPLSSSCSDHDDEVDADVSENEDNEPDREQHDSELTIEDVFLKISVTGSKGISVREALLNSFLGNLKLNRRSLPIPISISNSSGQEITTILSNKISSHGVGLLRRTHSVIRTLGLKVNCCYKLKYSGRSLGLVSQDATSVEKLVYNFQFVKEIKSEELESSDPEHTSGNSPTISRRLQGEEASNQPLVPAQLSEGVPAFWDVELGNVEKNGWRLAVDPCKILLKQIDCRYIEGKEFLVQLESENNELLNTSFCITSRLSGYFRKAIRFCRLAEYQFGDMLRMYYLGYRLLEDGEKMYCFRTEKISSEENSSEETQNTEPRKVARRRRKRSTVDAQRSDVDTGIFRFEWGPYFYANVGFNKPVMVTLFEILGLEHGEIDYPLKMRLSKGVGNQEEQQDFEIKIKPHHGGGFIENEAAFENFCGNPECGTILQFKFFGSTQADYIKDRFYCFELLTDTYELDEIPRSGGTGSQKDRAPKVAKKTAQPLSGPADVQNPATLNTTTPSPHLTVPGWVQAGQQVQALQLYPHQHHQQRHQQPHHQPASTAVTAPIPKIEGQHHTPGHEVDTTIHHPHSLLPVIRTFLQQGAAAEQQQQHEERTQQGGMQSQLMQQQQQELHPQHQPQHQLQQQPQPQQTTITTQPRNAPPIDLVSSVAASLKNHSDFLDPDLIAEYLDIFAFLFSGEEREMHGHIILQLAAGSSVQALQRTLERAVKRYR